MSVTAFRGPGVVTEMATRAGQATSGGADSGRYFVAGLFDRGHTDAAVRVSSLKELTDRFGDRPAYSAAWDSLSTYFAEGGSQAYVARVVGPAATVGTLTLKDRAGTPLNTLRIDALGAGTWSTGVTVQILDGTVAGTVKALIRAAGNVETFDNATSPADLANKLNDSRYVRGTDLGSATAAPNNLPAVLAETALSAGADDRTSVTTALMTAALDRFPSNLGTGVVALPGYTADLVGAALRTHAKTTRRVAILAAAVGASVADVKSLAQTLTSADGSYTMLAYPWVRITIAPGVTQLISPEGYVAAARARAHTAVGPWGAAAGVGSAARTLVGLATEVSQNDGSDLNAAGVSCIRTVAGQIMLYGYRSLAIDSVNYRLLSAQDTMNYIAQRAEDALARFVFAPMNEGVLGQVDGTLRGICDEVRLRGGLYPWYTNATPRVLIDPGYSVEVVGVNTRETLATGALNAQVAVRLTEGAELIHLTLIRVGLTAAV